MRQFFFKALAFLMGLGMSQAGAPHTIVWTDALLDNDITSNGTPLSSAFNFELGTFGSSFIPEEANLPLWRANWKLLDTTTYNDATKYFGDQAIQNWDTDDSSWHPDVSAAPADPATSFAEGEQVYIWIYNNLDQDETTEWGVYTRTGTGAWKLPDYIGGGQPDLTQYMVMSEANATPFGGTPVGQGLGSFTSPTSEFAYQTHGFNPVPEPTGLAILGFAVLGGLARRRR